MLRQSAMLFLLVSICIPGRAAEALETTQAELVTLPQEYRLDGVVEVINQSTISAQTTGQVLEILADVDDYVEKDALIIRLKSTEQRARLEQAQAELKAANARLRESQQEYQRVEEVYQRKLVAKSALDKATATLHSAQANQQAAAAAVDQAKEQLDYTQIRAPYSGIVTERLIEIGETATPGQRLMSGFSLEQLRVNIDVPQSLIAHLDTQGETTIELPDGTQVATVGTTIFPFADARSGTFKVRLQLPAGTQQLFPGMLVKCRFKAGSREYLVVPAASVVYRSEVTAVYVVASDGKISLRHIQTGQKRNGSRVTVLSGISAGEAVALDPVLAGSKLKQQVTGQ